MLNHCTLLACQTCVMVGNTSSCSKAAVAAAARAAERSAFLTRHGTSNPQAAVHEAEESNLRRSIHLQMHKCSHHQRAQATEPTQQHALVQHQQALLDGRKYGWPALTEAVAPPTQQFLKSWICRARQVNAQLFNQVCPCCCSTRTGRPDARVQLPPQQLSAVLRCFTAGTEHQHTVALSHNLHTRQTYFFSRAQYSTVVGWQRLSLP